MVVVRNGRVLVVHAKGSPVDADGVVRSEPISAFLAQSDRVSLFRPDSPAAASRAAAAAVGYAERRAPFDRAFSLRTREAVYCTELVWRALSVGYGEDVLPAKRVEYGRPVVTLADIERSDRLTWLGTSRRAVAGGAVNDRGA